MNQPDLFEPARLRRDHSPDAGKMIDGRGRRATSRAAYHEVDLSDREAEVMRHVLMHAGRDWTRAELARSMGWRDGPLCGRVNALVAKGRLIEGPARDCTTPGGRRGHALRAA